MPSAPVHSGEMSHDSEHGTVHRTGVHEDGSTTSAPFGKPTRVLAPAIDQAARRSKGMFDGLQASSAGLELGLSVGLSALFGIWLDGKLGTRPWMMIVFLIVGFIAGLRGVLRAVDRAERAASRG